MRYSVIAIEREYASGGSETGKNLAEKLGIPCYGQEILEMAAEKLNLSIKQLAEIEEKATGSVLYSLAAFVATFNSGQDIDMLTLEQKLAFVEADIIRNISLNPCIIVGRGAAAFLKDKSGVLKVFIHADNSVRVGRAVNIYGIEPNQAESVLRYYDKRRSNYFKAVTGVGWQDPDTYHMFLNSGKLGIDLIADILYEIVK